MKKICSILLMMVSIVCSGLILSSCSNGYKKMYLTVEYALPTGDDNVEWNEIDISKGLDYYLSDNVKAEDGSAYLLYLRVNVKGTSKKIKSLYVSQSGTTSAMLGDTESSSTLKVTPNQAFKVSVHNIGSVNFNVKPSEGGDDKTISFNINIWQQLTKVEANSECVPAMVVGSSLNFDKLTNLIKYHPLEETNQTGVNFEIESVGELNHVTREFTPNVNSEQLLEKITLDNKILSVDQSYGLTNQNNVIKLKATSSYYEELVNTKKLINEEDAKNLITEVYVYIVENFQNDATNKSLTVSYSSERASAEDKEVGNSLKLYSSSIDSDYKSVNIYAYTAESIYSFIGEPGMELKVYIRDITDSGINSATPYVLYDYKNEVNHDIGLQISELDKDLTNVNKLGIKLEAIKSARYQIKLKVDFTAFDFGGSDINPTDFLTQEIVVTIESLATGVQINGAAYLEKNSVQTIADINTKAPAVLYSYYDSKELGLPLQINTHIPESVNKDVTVAFYKNVTWNGSVVSVGDKVSDIQLLRGQNHIVENNNGEYTINNGGQTLYLNFANEPSDLEKVYMVCKVVSTPDTFEGVAITKQYKTIVIEIPVRTAVRGLSIKNQAGNTLSGLFEKGVQNTAYIGLNALNTNNVDVSEIEVKSKLGNIQFSKDGNSWQSSVLLSQLTKTNNGDYQVYFKSNASSINSVEDSIYIQAQNGVSQTADVTFVSVMEADDIEISWDSAYAWTSTLSTDDYSYIALQYGKSLDFSVLGNGQKDTIKNIDVKSLPSVPTGKTIDKFSSSAVSVKELNENTFRVETGNGRIGYTSVIELTVDFYINDGGVIKLSSKTFIYEIAVYTPAQDLNISADKDTLIYINEYYQNIAKMRIDATINRATPNIYFSNDEIKSEIEINSSIYGIKVEGSLFEYYGDGEYFNGDLVADASGNYYLGDSLSVNLRAVKDLSDLKNTYLYLDFTIYQFGNETTFSARQNIYIGDHTKSDTIIVESQQVDKYSNIYMNLLKDENKKAELVAYVNENATYNELGYLLYSIAADKTLTPYTGSDLTVGYDAEEDLFTITAGDNGGEYVLTIYTRDTYNGELTDDVVKTSIKINVSDGTENNPYLINNLADFKLIAKNLDKHFRLSGSFDISALDSNVNKDNDLWWTDNGGARNLTFTGSLDGALTIYNPNTGAEIVEQYILSGLTIKNSVNVTNDYYGLFTANAGTIKNIIFDEVKFEITINTSQTDPHIGAIAGENVGTIENCSVIIDESAIRVEDGASFGNLYVGLIAGANYGKIVFNGNNSGAYMLDCNQGGKLTITIESGIEALGQANDPDGNGSEEPKGANIYGGGIAGLNAKTGEIAGDYEDNSSRSLRSLLTGIVNIELNVDNDEKVPVTMGDIALGGAVGLNSDSAVVKNIAITGKLVGYDKISLGGLVGINNRARVLESANIGMVLDAGDKSAYTGTIIKYHGTEGAGELLLEQNIGGIIGANTQGTLDNIRVMFIELESADVSVAYGISYIKGLGNIGGIIGKASNTYITRAYVENFIELTDDETNNTYNIIGNNANIGGFIGENSGNNVIVGLLNVNIDAGSIVVYEFGKDLTYSYVYFVGTIKKSSAETYKNTTIENSSYINATYIDSTNNDPTTKTQNIDTTKVTIIAIATDTNDDNVLDTNIYNVEFNNGETAKVYWGKDNLINNGLPYLAYILDGETEPIYTISIQPTEIIVNADDKWFDNDNNFTGETFEKYDNGIFIQYTISGDGVTTEDEIAATAIVYYNLGGNNTYKLVSDNGEYGLIEKIILPSIASGAYNIKVVAGSGVITLGDDTITFNKTGRVELEFISIYDKNIRDRVVIFVEEPINEDTVDVNIESSSANINTTDITVGGNTVSAISYNTYKGSNTIMNIGLTETEVNFENVCFDETKAYVIATVEGSVVDDKGSDVANASTYYEYKALTTAIDASKGKYNLGEYEFTSIDLPKDVQYIEVTMKFSVYLNLSRYQITDSKTLLDLTSNMDTLLGEKYVVVRIHNSAKDIQIIPSNIVAQSGEQIDIKAVLVTGYVGSPVAGEQTVNSNNLQIGVNPNQMLVNIDNQDSINMELVAIGNNELMEHINNQQSIWNLFKTPRVIYKHVQDVGYEFGINLELEDKFKAIVNNCEFKLTIYAKSERTVNGDVFITFAPQQLTTFRTEFYSELAVTTGAGATVEAEYITGQTESALIIPGSSGLLKIFADKTFAKFDNIVISSSVVDIRGEEYYIYFEQMVYDEGNKVYKSLRGTTSNDNSLELQKYTYSDLSYDGVIFVRAIIGSVVGIRQSFTVTVTADTYDIDGKVVQVDKEKVLLTYYKPGVNISVSNVEEIIKDNKQVYLIEKNSSVSVITANVFGYELNVSPDYNVYKLEKGPDGKDISVPTSSVRIVEQGGITKLEDGSTNITYLLIVSNFDEPFRIVFIMSLTEEGHTLTSRSQELTFYPVDYIINNFSLKGVANNEFNIGIDTSRNIEFVFTTKQTSTDKLNAINTAINADLGNKVLDTMYVNVRDNNLNIERQNFSRFVGTETSETTNSFKVIQNVDGTYRIKAMSKDQRTVYIDIYYKYSFNNSINKYTIKFSDVRPSGEEGWRLLHTEFMLNLNVTTSVDAPEPIYDANGLASMRDGQNYILMNDINVEGWTPSVANISSLDGNGYVINIKSFNIAIGATTNVGLFASIPQGAIIKNVVINIGDLNSALYIQDDNTPNVTAYVGMLAGENNGLIYNCEVINLSSSNKTINIITGETYNLIFGGLVANNLGNITNSRVGTEYFEKIRVNDGNVSRVKLTAKEITFNARGIMAGLVGINGSSTISSIISNSYVANTSIINTSNIGDDSVNRTAGLVATNHNTSTIAYSYIKGTESSILTTRGRTTGAKLHASGSGSVAGFVFENAGNIHDCYSNITCYTNSSVVSGFVYNNTASGSIKQCYSASSVNAEKENLATKLPFVGIGIGKSNLQELLNYGELINCYYLEDETSDYDLDYELPSIDTQEPSALSLEGFANSSNLNNFAFINTTSRDHQFNGVWTHSSSIDSNKSTYGIGNISLPELISANQVARSIRYLKSEQRNEDLNYEYLEATGYHKGSSNNPYIIRDVQEYKDVFNGTNPDSSLMSMAGYVRFVDDINFKDEQGNYESIGTRSGYTLGDSNNNLFTVIDGNGMTISGVSINYGEESVESIGLFSTIYNSVIKSLNIEFENSVIGSTEAQFAGGVAGYANNTYFVDIDLNGNSVEVNAKNIAGGLVGALVGDNSGIANVSSNISSISGDKTTNSYTANSLKDYSLKQTNNIGLSYSGGIAGIIDIGSSINNNINLSKLTVNGISVEGVHAGGVVGYLGENVYATRLSNYIGTSTQVSGQEVAGGLVGENLGYIQLSQVGYEIDTQQTFDKNIADYINSGAIDSLNVTSHGNLTAVTGNGKVGGFVGVNNGGEISNSYTKASVLVGDGFNTKYVGGFAGQTNGGTFKSVYTQSHINIPENTQKAYIGGLFGYLNSGETTKNVWVDNMVSATVFDKAQINALTYEITGEKANAQMKFDNDLHIDYTSALKSSDVLVTKPQSNSNQNCDIYYGVFDEELFKHVYEYEDGGETKTKVLNKISNTSFGNATLYDMNALYDLSHINQNKTYETLFIDWEPNYWDLDNTKFMPVLREDNVVSLIELRTPEDVLRIANKLDGNYILMNDINVSNISEHNHIVYGTFTGTITGKQQENGYPSFTNITLNATTSDCQTAGFFQSTSGAIFTNIGFKYSKMILGQNSDGSNTQFTNVGGVTAKDTDSQFENIIVAPQDVSTTINTNSDNEHTVDNFGGMIGESQRSTVIGGNVSINIGESESNLINLREGGQSTLGGVVGKLMGGAITDDNNVFGGLISDVNFKGNIYANTTGSSVGGIAGYTDYTGIYNSTVGNFTSSDVIPVTMNININNSITGASGENKAVNNIGGLVGYATNSLLTEAQSISKMIFTGGNSGSSHIGGMVGYSAGSIKLANNTYEPVVYDGYSELVVETPDADKLTMNIGGVIGWSRGYAKLSTIVTKLTIAKEEGKGGHVGYLTVGGAIAATDENTDISSMMIYLENCYLSYTDCLLAGGVIGYINKIDPNAPTTHNISNVGVAGQFFGEDGLTTVDLDEGNINKLAIMGGMIGATANVTNKLISNLDNVNVNITDSYTALTLSTANINGNDDTNQKTLYTGAIVGLNNLVTISTSGVVYSSDYTLALDNNEGNEDEDRLCNVTANALLSNQALTSSKWTMNGGHLPILKDVNDILIEHNWTNSTASDYVLGFEGTAFKPIEITIDNISSISVDYKYYRITSQIAMTGTSISSLNGMLLGSNNNIITDNQFITNINTHSAVSNINLYIKYGTSFSTAIGLIANDNDGTIFMCSVNYTNVSASSNSAMVINNNGCIAYSYNTGYLKATSSTVDYAGIAINNIGTISNCYYTGYMDNKMSTYGLVVNNTGYIENSYSAGSAKGAIKYYDAEYFGRLHNVYFDIYANFNDSKPWQEGEYDKPEWKTTDELTTSIFEGHWTAYGFDNVTYDEAGNITGGMSYNYGYPIHDIKQKTSIDGGALSYIDIKAKPTGNGMFEVVTDNEEQVKTYVLDSESLGLAYYEVGNVVNGIDSEWNHITYIDNSFLISNLGVLNQINKLITSTTEGENTITTNRTEGAYFTLEYDILMIGFGEDVETRSAIIEEIESKIPKGADLLTNFTGVGAIDGFKGTFISRSYLEDASTYTIRSVTATKSMNTEDVATITVVGSDSTTGVVMESRIIKNLTGPIFSNLGSGAQIVSISLTESISSSSALAQTVSGESYIVAVTMTGKTFVSMGADKEKVLGSAGLIETIESETDVYIDTISLESEFKLIGNNRVAGLIGYNQGKAYINNINMNATILSSGVSNASGLVYNNAGEVTIISAERGSFNTTFEGCDDLSISGLAMINSGEIIGSNITIKSKITADNNSDQAQDIAGLVGEMSDGSLYGFKVEFDCEKISTTRFAGAISKLSGGIVGDDDTGNIIDISLPKEITASQFGGAVATVLGKAKLSNVSISGDINIIANTNGNEDTAFGYVIGDYQAQLNEINVTISGKKFYVKGGINVGGIIGKASNLEFNFTSDAPSNVIGVKGLENVGGFIGSVLAGTVTFAKDSELWPVQSEEAYAEVDVYVLDEGFIKASNFGGIFGKIKDATTDGDAGNVPEIKLEQLGGASKNTATVAEGDEFGGSDDGSGESSSNGRLYFKNSNPVCSAEITSVKFNISNASSFDANTVSNIGGIAGYSDASIYRAINCAIIGCKDSLNQESCSFSEDAYNFLNVGGVVGKVATKVTLVNCANTEAVYGYGFVGGIVGYAQENLTIAIQNDANNGSVTVTNIGQQTSLGNSIIVDDIIPSTANTLAGTGAGSGVSSDTVIFGFADVGGIVGRVNGMFIAGYVEMDISVIGIANVGGFAGFVNGKASITNSKLTNNSEEINLIIAGNVNVGGLIGYLVGGQAASIGDAGSSISTVNIIPKKTFATATDDVVGQIIVRGLVHEQEETQKSESGSTKTYTYYYLPTNIGGVVGNVANTSFNNVKALVRVETEDKHPVNTDEGKYVTVNMVKNHIAYTAPKESVGIEYPGSFYPPDGATRNINYNIVNSGIGGFAGSIDDASFNKCFTYGDVYAPYGINVGGAVGFMYNETIILPQMPTAKSEIEGKEYYSSSTINELPENVDEMFAIDHPLQVAGKIFVGGFIGKVGNNIDSKLFSMVPYIDVQAYTIIEGEGEGRKKVEGIMTGSCIGGIIGYSTGMVSGISLIGTGESPLRIFNYTETLSSGSKYVGVIAGRVDGGMLDCTISPNYCGAKWDEDKELYVTNSSNFTVKYNDTQVWVDDGVHIKLDDQEEHFRTSSATPAGTYNYNNDGKVIIVKDSDTPIINITKGEDHSNGKDYSTISKIEYLQSGLVYERIESNGDGGTFKVTSNDQALTFVEGGIIQDYETYNYGGLVGLASISRDADEYVVKGTHYYAFTIDCLQSYNFKSGTTYYDYEERDNKQIVTAIPHYVNMSHITVSGSNLTDLYNEEGAHDTPSDGATTGKTYAELAVDDASVQHWSLKFLNDKLGLGLSSENINNLTLTLEWKIKNSTDIKLESSSAVINGLPRSAETNTATTYESFIKKLSITSQSSMPGPASRDIDNMRTSLIKKFESLGLLHENIYESNSESEHKDVTNHNPLNPEAKGWAKDYTMFKSMAICYQQNFEESGDYWQVLYDASYITEVYYVYPEITDTEGEIIEESPEIVYTRYKTNDGIERLYCKFGIATWEEGFVDTLAGDSALDKNHKVSIGDLQGTLLESRKRFYQHIDDALLNEEVDEEETAKKGLTRGYTYINIGDGEETKRFNFTSVYGSFKENDNPDYYSASGSVFEITGAPQDYSNKIKIKGFWAKFWDIAWTVVKVVGSIAITFVPVVGVGMKVVTIGSKFAKIVYKAHKAIEWLKKANKLRKLIYATVVLIALASNFTGPSYVPAKFNQINNMSMGLETMAYTRYIDYDNGKQLVSIDKMTNILTEVRIFTNEDNPTVYEENYAEMPYTTYASGNVMPFDMGTWIDIDVDYTQIGDGVWKAQVPKYVEDRGELYIYAQAAIVGQKLYTGVQPWDGELRETNYKYAEADGYYYIWNAEYDHSIVKSIASTYDEDNASWPLENEEKKNFEDKYSVSLTTTKSVKHNIVKGSKTATEAQEDPAYNGKVVLNNLKWNIVTNNQGWAGGLCVLQDWGTVQYYTDRPEGICITKTACYSEDAQGNRTYAWTSSGLDNPESITVYGVKGSSGGVLTEDDITVYLSPWNANGNAFTSGLSSTEINNSLPAANKISGDYYYQCNESATGVSRERTYYLVQEHDKRIEDGIVWLQITENTTTGALYLENGVAAADNKDLSTDLNEYYIANPIQNGKNVYADTATYKGYNSGQFGYWYELVDGKWYTRNSMENLIVDSTIVDDNILYQNIYGEIDNNGVNYFYYNKYVHTGGDVHLYTNYMFEANRNITYKTYNEEGKSEGTESIDISQPLFKPRGSERTVLVECARVSLSSSYSMIYYTNQTSTSSMGTITCV